MRRLRIVLSVIAPMVLGACTTQVARDEARPPSPHRVLLRQYQNNANGNSAIVMTRDAEALPSGCGITVTIDQKSVVVLEPGEVFVAYVDATAHKLGAKYRKGCEGPPDKLDVTTHAGKALGVRVHLALFDGVFQTASETELGN